jgi:hypothetical protein
VFTQQQTWTAQDGWSALQDPPRANEAQLVLLFGAPSPAADPSIFAELRCAYPKARIISCSTGGEIVGTRVVDESLVATAATFDFTSIAATAHHIADASESGAVGAAIAASLPHEGLVHVFVLSDGLRVNGSALVRGITGGLPAHVGVTGGLAGDADRFACTVVGLDGPAGSGNVVAVGFYGDRLRVGMGSLGGWEMFGPDRVVTRSEGSVVYELDGQPALELYRRYLGPHAAGLPASGLLFPLKIHGGDCDQGLVRTLLAVDADAGSLTFAGDVPQGMYARLMRANLDKLVDGASTAATRSAQRLAGSEPNLAVLISCVGRKWVLKQRVEEEVESVRDVLGGRAVLTGFYSYGEISPFTPDARCELHNQTMTITTFAEV